MINGAKNGAKNGGINGGIKKISAQEGPQSEFLSTNADICIYGGSAGSGKSYALLIDPLRYINNSGYTATILRKTSPQIRNSGGLWDTSLKLYLDVNAKPIESRLSWKFDSGAEVRFAHMEYEQDKYNFDGSQICMIGFDELQWFSETQFFYMLSRNRSVCGIKPYIRATCNPDSESWLRTFIDYWIGKDGLPIKERSGKIRYMTRVDGVVKWADTKNELLKNNPQFVNDYNQLRNEYLNKKGNKQGNELELLKKEYTDKIYKIKNIALEGIKSVTFISAKVEDNKILLETNPSYLANLKALPLVERERLLYGNWNIKAESGKFFNRNWFKIIDQFQLDKIMNDNVEEIKECRYWDFAATAPSSKNKDPDYTVGVKIRKIGLKYFIIDVIRVRLNPAELEKLFLDTTKQDKIIAEELGINYMVRWEQEGGSAGKKETYRLQSMLSGYDCRGISTGGKNKETRAKPFAIQSEIGNVVLLRDKWNDDYLQELHMFADPTTKHDDQIDGSSGAFNSLTSVYIRPTIINEDKKISEEERIQKRIEEYNELEEDFLNGDDI